MSSGTILVILIIAAVIGFGGYAYRTALLDRITSRTGYHVKRDIRYADGSARRTLDLYLPDHPGENAPIIVFFHGGDWMHGTKNIYRFVAQPFASRGFMVAIPCYRLYPETAFPGFVEDAALAVAHLWRSQMRADGSPRPFVLMGHSAGAHIAALLATDLRYLDAVGVPGDQLWGLIGISGAYDFMPLTDHKYEGVFPADKRDESQPIRFVDGSEAPALLITGAPDQKVDIGNTFRFMHRIEEKGGKVTQRTYPGVSHTGTISALAEALPIRKPPVLQEILAFLAKAMVTGAPPKA